MKEELKQGIALMRYGAIAPLIAGLDEEYPSQSAFYEEIAAKGITGPDGKVRHYAPATIEKWYLNYKKYGFDALVPKARADAGMSRKLDDELQEQIRYLKMCIRDRYRTAQLVCNTFDQYFFYTALTGDFESSFNNHIFCYSLLRHCSTSV